MKKFYNNYSFALQIFLKTTWDHFIFSLFKRYWIKYPVKIICIGSIANLYRGSMKNTENIIKFVNKYSPRHLFSNLFVLKKINKPGQDNIDKIIIGKIWKKL